MRKAIALTHVDFEDLGTLGTELAHAGYAIEMVNACIADLSVPELVNADLLVVLGGPIGVYEREAYPFLDAELGLIRLRLKEKRSVIGICLGAQLIAAACGASVHPGTQGKEIGWAPIHAGRDAALYPEFAALLAPGLCVLHWHGDTFHLPANSHHLAATNAYSSQAFAIGRHALGLQFHVEVSARGLERWYVGHACELGAAKVSVAELRQQSEKFAPALEEASRQFWKEWLRKVADSVEDSRVAV